MCVNQAKIVTQTSGAKYLFVQQEEGCKVWRANSGAGGFPRRKLISLGGQNKEQHWHLPEKAKGQHNAHFLRQICQAKRLRTKWKWSTRSAPFKRTLTSCWAPIYGSIEFATTTTLPPLCRCKKLTKSVHKQGNAFQFLIAEQGMCSSVDKSICHKHFCGKTDLLGGHKNGQMKFTYNFKVVVRHFIWY